MMDEPVNVASEAFLNALAAIESGVWGTPCAVELGDGQILDVSLAWENKRFGDAGEWVNPRNIVKVSDCLKRMPARFAHLIHDAGESGMGYHVYTVDLKDGSSFVHIAENLAIDLVDLPSGYMPKDIIAVRPHMGRDHMGVGEYRQLQGYASVEYAKPMGTAR